MQQNKGQQGFSLIELLIVVAIIGIIAAIAIPNLLASKRSANEGSALSSMRVISSSEASYQATGGGGNYGDLAALADAGFLDTVLGGGTKSGYTFEATPFEADDANPARFTATGVPVTHISSGTVTATGTRSFATLETGVVYFNRDAAAPTVAEDTREVTEGTPLDTLEAAVAP